MAAEWIRMRVDLVGDPRVIRIARDVQRMSAGHPPDINRTTREVIGGLLLVWGAADTHGLVDGDDVILRGSSPDDLDVISGIEGFGSSMLQVGWISLVDDSIRFEKFMTYNIPKEEHARRRKLDAKRKARKRTGTPADNDRTSAGNPEMSAGIPPDIDRNSEECPGDIRSLQVQDRDKENPIVPRDEGGGAPLDGTKAAAAWNDLADRHGLAPVDGPVREKALESLSKRLRDYPDLWHRLDRAMAARGEYARKNGLPKFGQLLNAAGLEKLLHGDYADPPAKAAEKDPATVEREAALRRTAEALEPPDDDRLAAEFERASSEWSGE